MRKHGRRISLIALPSVIIALTAVVLLNHSRADNQYEVIESYLGRLGEIIEEANRNYYKDVDTEKLLEGALRGAVAALNDPYSFYQKPEQQQREQEDLFFGQFGGLGIKIYPEQQSDHALVKVSSALPNSPAQRADLRPGDAIVKVDGKSVVLGSATGLAMDDVVAMLRGAVGEPVTITIVRRNRIQPIEKTLIRDVIQPKSVQWKVLEDGIVYIELDTFKNQSLDEFRKAIRESQRETELKAVILDLRDNLGGLLTAAEGIADAFIDEGLIVYTKGKRRDFAREYPATSGMVVPKEVELVILVDGQSASGSEIVAGAVKDHARGILVGEKTFGKGVVQQRFNLENGGAVSLTISSYYTPNGVSIDGEGIEPHVFVEPDRLSEEEALARERARDSHIVDDFVERFLEDYEKEHGETPMDFETLESRVSEIQALLEQEGIALLEKTVWHETRNIFDLNVGNERFADMQNDRQLREALRIVTEVGVAKVLSGDYEQPIVQDTGAVH